MHDLTKEYKSIKKIFDSFKSLGYSRSWSGESERVMYSDYHLISNPSISVNLTKFSIQICLEVAIGEDSYEIGAIWDSLPEEFRNEMCYHLDILQLINNSVD